MPNWTQNEVRIYGEPEALKELKEFVKSDESPFDFNRILPMPESLNLTSGSITYHGKKAFDEGVDAVRELDPEVRLHARKNIANNILFDAFDWYDWSIAKWGTKWNAKGVVEDEDIDGNCIGYKFDTAWSGPYGICMALKEMFPELTFVWECLDESDGDLILDENGEPLLDENGEEQYYKWEENPHVYRLDKR